MKKSKRNNTLYCVLIIISLSHFLVANSLIKAIGRVITPDPTSTWTAGEVTKDASGISMVYVPSGEFKFGISSRELESICTSLLKDDKPSDCAKTIIDNTGLSAGKQIAVSGFWMDIYEVTIEQFKSCTNPGPVQYCRQIDLEQFPELRDNIQKPQVGVMWYDAVTFCNLRQARLPTEAEWEYAAKGSVGNLFPWGNSPDEKYTTLKSTYPVGSNASNKSWAGIYDMAGNAAEWVEDRYIAYSPQSDLWVQDDASRVVRGGSWNDSPLSMLTFYRTRGNPLEQSQRIGFRCVRTTDPHG